MNWHELRRRVLEEDYMDGAELVQRRRRSRQMKHGIWLVPGIVVAVVPTMILDGWSWLMAAAAALCCYGGVSAYRLGVQWERRWNELIRERSTRTPPP